MSELKYIYLNPIEKSLSRPLWTVLIPTYNCANYLKEALISILKQDPGVDKMEIIVVDDHSTKDDPGEIVKTIAGDRVQFFSQKENVGKVRNFETGLKKSRGLLIHQLHGDDKVREGFYNAIEKAFNEFPESGAVFCRSLYIDENGTWTNISGIEKYEGGILPDILGKLIIRQCIQTPSMVVKRSVYEEIGTFHRAFDCMEDWEMWIRIASKYPISFINKVLVEYRVHSKSTTSGAFMNGGFFNEHAMITEIIKNTMSDKISIEDIRNRNYEHAMYMINNLKINKLNRKEKITTIRRIIQLSKHPKVLYNLLNCIY